MLVAELLGEEEKAVLRLLVYRRAIGLRESQELTEGVRNRISGYELYNEEQYQEKKSELMWLGRVFKKLC